MSVNDLTEKQVDILVNGGQQASYDQRANSANYDVSVSGSGTTPVDRSRSQYGWTDVFGSTSITDSVSTQYSNNVYAFIRFDGVVTDLGVNMNNTEIIVNNTSVAGPTDLGGGPAGLGWSGSVSGGTIDVEVACSGSPDPGFERVSLTSAVVSTDDPNVDITVDGVTQS